MDAKGMTQYVVTEYALLDVSACEHELFYKRSWHSMTIDKSIFQCFPAVREDLPVGKFLGQMDAMNESNRFIHSLKAFI